MVRPIKKSYSDLTIIIPTLNEEGNIYQMLRLLKFYYRDAEIFVVDDGSRDKTRYLVRKAQIQNKNIRWINRKDRPIHGITASVVEGIRDCTTKYYVVIDADFQHPIEKIKEIHERLSEYDLVIGRRISEAGWDWKRKALSETAIFMGKVRLMLNGKIIDDVVSGFFGGKTYFTKYIFSWHSSKFQMAGYKVLFDILKYMPTNMKVGYVDYNFMLRAKGESKLGKKQIIEYMKAVFS